MGRRSLGGGLRGARPQPVHSLYTFGFIDPQNGPHTVHTMLMPAPRACPYGVLL